MGTGFLTVPGTVSRGPFGSLFLSVIIAILQRAAPENNFYLTFHESTMQIVPNSCKGNSSPRSHCFPAVFPAHDANMIMRPRSLILKGIPPAPAKCNLLKVQPSNY